MSLPGGNQTPYRAPCGGTVVCANGPRYQHAKASEQNVPVFIYDSTVPNWAGGSDIGPYERFANIAPNGCSVGCLGISNSTPPCEQWIGLDGSQFNLATPPPTPSFYQPQMLTDVSVANGGSGYSLGDILHLNGANTSNYIGPGSGGAIITVSGVNANTGAIISVSVSQAGSYQNAPGSPDTAFGGHGNGASFNVTFGNQTENLSPCFKYGYKNVQAMRQWHGTPGYFFNNPLSIYPCNSTIYGVDCFSNTFEDYSNSASQTKYCSAAYEITGTFSEFASCGFYEDTVTSCPGSAFTDSYFADISCDPLSGVCTVNSADAGCGAAASYAYLLSMGVADWVARFTTWSNSAFGPESHPSSCFEISCSGSGYSFAGYQGCPNTYPYQTGSGSWSLGSNSFSATRTYETLDHGDAGFFGSTETESVSVTDSSVSYSYIAQQELEGSNAWTTTTEFTLAINLGSTNTSADVLSDIVNLLNKWDLTNDAQYPWRNDTFTSIAPLVCRNEVPANVNPFTFGAFSPNTTQIADCCGRSPSDPEYIPVCQSDILTDSSALIYDGSIIGAPLPAGYQQAFDFYYLDYQTCVTDTGEVGYLYGWGQVNRGQNGIPLTATHWTPNNLAWQFPPGAWIFYNLNPSWVECNPDVTLGYVYPPATICVAQKWAETKMGFASQNFFRPAGTDKFAFDETNVLAINSINTTNGVTTVYCIDPVECSNANANPSAGSGIWGGNAVNGFFEVTGNGNPFTLGTRIFNLPSDWHSNSNDDTSCFGLLRWPNSPAILGIPASPMLPMPTLSSSQPIPFLSWA